jgi:hypothetical protein
MWVIEIVVNATELHRPGIVCASLSGGVSVSSLYIEPEEKYVGQLVRLVAHIKNMEFEDISAGTVTGALSMLRTRNYLKSCAGFFLRYERFKIWQWMLSLGALLTRKRFIFFTSSFYQMNKLASQLKSVVLGYTPYFLKSSVIASFSVPDFIIRLLWPRFSKKIIYQKRLLEDLERAIKNEVALFAFNPPSRSPRFASEAGNSPPVRVGMDSERNSASARFSLRRSEEKDSTGVSPWSFKTFLILRATSHPPETI